ncbi:MAG: tetratricopeptide repeat protein [Bdellovibrionota bacterium]
MLKKLSTLILTFLVAIFLPSCGADLQTDSRLAEVAHRARAEAPFGPRTIQAFEQLAKYRTSRGWSRAAESAYIDALAAALEGGGPDDPAVGRLLLAIGTLYCDRENCPRARPMFERALEIFEKQEDGSRREIAKCLEALARVSRSEGDETGAAVLGEQARLLDVSKNSWSLAANR